jgi:hypothetical protein
MGMTSDQGPLGLGDPQLSPKNTVQASCNGLFSEWDLDHRIQLNKR